MNEVSELVQRGLKLERDGDAAGAEAAFRRADARGSGPAALHLGTLLIDLGHLDDALEALARAEGRGRADAAVYTGDLLADSGDERGAELAYRRADAAGVADGSFSLGELLLERGDYGRARNAFATAQDRGHPEATERLTTLAHVPAPDAPDEAPLAFEGIYEHRDADGTAFLRFYPDERVIQVSSTPEATAAQIDAWFRWEHDAPAKGTFKLRGDEIIFETTSRWGTVRYSGRIVTPALLVLDTHSLINGFRAEGLRFGLAE